MKILLYSVSFLMLILSCEKETAGIDSMRNEVNFFSDKSSYTKTDTIYLSLDNNSDSCIVFGLRCSRFLEMSYQKEDNGEWSDELWFDYMSLRCLTMMDSVKSNNSYYHSLPADLFKQSGIFRLILTEEITSNSFKIN